jgi:hypothetical protein
MEREVADIDALMRTVAAEARKEALPECSGAGLEDLPEWWMALYFDKALRPHEKKIAEEHLASCSRCLAQYALMAKTISEVAPDQIPAFPAEESEKALQMILRDFPAMTEVEKLLSILREAIERGGRAARDLLETIAGAFLPPEMAVCKAWSLSQSAAAQSPGVEFRPPAAHITMWMHKGKSIRLMATEHRKTESMKEHLEVLIECREMAGRTMRFSIAGMEREATFDSEGRFFETIMGDEMERMLKALPAIVIPQED